MLMDDSFECHFQNPIDPILNDAFQIFLKPSFKNHLSQGEVDNILVRDTDDLLLSLFMEFTHPKFKPEVIPEMSSPLFRIVENETYDDT